MQEKPKSNFSTKNFIVALLILNIIPNAFKFLNVEGSGHPVVWSLFNMILTGIYGILHNLYHILYEKNMSRMRQRIRMHS